MRRNAKTDANHAVIADAFRDYGCSVAQTFMLGEGFPDLVCALQGRTWMVEVKDGTKPPSKRQLTPDQITFRATWRGMIFVVHRLADVPDVIDQVLNSTEVLFNPCLDKPVLKVRNVRSRKAKQ